MTNKTDILHIQRINTLEGFYSLNEKWNALLNESPVNSFFLRWEWLYNWWNAYKEDNYDLSILLVFRSNNLIGIAPLYVKKNSWKDLITIRRLMFLGTKEGSVISEYMDIIYRAGEEEAVIREITKFIVQQDLCDDIFLNLIDASSMTIPLLEQTAHDMKFLYIVNNKVESPYINLQSSYDDFLKGLTASMRHKIRDNERNLRKYSDIIFRKTSNILEFDKDFEELIRLHQIRWESRKFAGSFTGGRFKNFQKMVMPDMLKNGHLELRFLSVSGRNIAALYNVNYNNKIYFYQGGLDVSFDKNLAPGFLLHDYCIEEAIKAGLREYDFLLMGNLDSYKKHWAKDSKYMCGIYMARPGIVKHGVQFKNKMESVYHTIKNSGSIH
jgi:CelD/BcsL family acetyltransferase involved in cellulose biosynthesis